MNTGKPSSAASKEKRLREQRSRTGSSPEGQTGHSRPNPGNAGAGFWGVNTTDRIAAYLATGRNADLPELVRRWIGDAEGAEQDEITGIVLKDHDARQECECCGCVPTSHIIGVSLAESENWKAISADFYACKDCSVEWEAAADAIEARSCNRRALARALQSPGLRARVGG